MMLPGEIEVAHFKVRSLSATALQAPNNGAIVFRDFVNRVGMSGRKQVVSIGEFVNRIGVSLASQRDQQVTIKKYRTMLRLTDNPRNHPYIYLLPGRTPEYCPTTELYLWRPI